MMGLFFGKQIGVFLFSFISVKLKIAEMPSNSAIFSHKVPVLFLHASKTKKNVRAQNEFVNKKKKRR